jgi:outer membrane protein assembly factor BamB
MKLQDLVFVGLNGRVAALDIAAGETIWEWRSPKGGSYVTLLLDRQTLVAGVNGYIYGLDALSGEQLWFNELKGYGIGVTSLASLSGSSSQPVVLEAAAADAAAADASAIAATAAASS